jgi:LPS export ABC transporter protein LptC
VKKIKNILIIGILCVVAFWIGLYAFRPQKPPTQPPPTSAGPVASGQVGLQEINFVQVKDGIKLWELKAEVVTYQQSKNEVACKKLSLTYYPKGERPLTMVGNLGRLDTQKKNVFIEGEVVISTPDGYELKVPSLYYKDEKREVYTDEAFTFKGPNVSIYGQGMTMNLDTQLVKVRKKAKMTLSS